MIPKLVSKPPMLLGVLACFAVAPGCGSEEVAGDDGGSPGGSGTGGTGSAAGEGGAGGDAGGASGGGGAGAPEVRVYISANTDRFPHADGLSGQTALAASGGVRSLTLYRDVADPAPLVLFDHGANVVEVGYDDGDDTLVAVAPTSSLVAGSYTLARLSQSYSRYQLEATLHTLDGPAPGVLDSVMVMSDGTLLDGELRDAGHYELSFVGSGESFTKSGEDFPIPIYSFTAGASAVHEMGEWAVYFPVALELPSDATLDVEIRVDVNLDRAFRWTDLLLLGYELGVFDVTETSYEPVIRFGGNRFDVTLAALAP